MSSKQARTNDRSKAKNRPPIVRQGLYDGSQSSDDILVTGHSTGAANTEMEAMSHQVSIDAGRVPDYPIESVPRDFGTAYDATEDANEDDDLDFSGGPGLYGPKPNLLTARTLDGKSIGGSRSYWNIALWSAAGAAAVGAASFGAYLWLRSQSKNAPKNV